METKINLIEILKDKPLNLKLYDAVRNIDVFLEALFENINKIRCKLDEDGRHMIYYSHKGTLVDYEDGIVALVPSKEMRNWSKFAWKKGDILVNKDAEVHVIFNGFKDDTYKTFNGQYYLWEEGGSIVNFEEDEDYMQTSEFNKENKEDAQEYIHKIEKELGGKLNMETLEIKKPQLEFKDGDIVCISGMGYLAYGIVKSIDNSSKKLEYYVLNDMSTLKFEDWLSFEDKQIQPITETQQTILFDALTKENKRWDAEKKQIVDLKPEVELKPFDKVWVKDNPYGSWEPALFWKKVDAIDLHPYMVIGGKRYRFCEPYEGNEHFLND